ncbi:ankyrin repeat protein [Aspergillus sp. HF37]|nr:ankyrin repeat protein [Aspergillus sp. HF37]
MTTIRLPPGPIDDLIYSARVGDLAALKEDLAEQAQTHGCGEAEIVASAVDSEPEAEGGTGGCLLHYPAANGNLEILNYLLQTVQQGEGDGRGIVNHRNHSGNTPLHWAALNAHLECVKALVAAGADVGIKNDAGLDAVFLAERAAWSANGDGEEQGQEGESGEGEGEGEGEAEDKGRMSPGREVVEWLLTCESKDEGEGEGKEEQENEATDGDGK